MKKTIVYLIIFLFVGALSAQENKVTVSGNITDASTGEDLIGAAVFIPEYAIGTVTNAYGFYSLEIPNDSLTLVYSFLGLETQELSISGTSDVTFDIQLKPEIKQQVAVVITDKKAVEANVESTSTGKVGLKMTAVKKIPALLGEVDLIKAIQLLPGVQAVGEGSSGFYVRGGNADQNLVILDEAPIYNPSHLLGFFSSFNPDAIKDMQFYKGFVPATYGGRLSSVLDIRMKEGNSKKFAVHGGVGTVMSRLAIEAPMGKRASFIVAGRRSYLDLIAKTYFAISKEEDIGDDQFYFYDLNAKGNYRINNKNRVYVSGYFGRDVFSMEDQKIRWGNTTTSLRWNRLISPKVFSNFSYYYSKYDYFLEFKDELSSAQWESYLQEHSLKADLGKYINPNNTLKFGAQIIRHDNDPGRISVEQTGEETEEINIQRDISLESALYIHNERIINNKLKIDGGLRFSSLMNTGKKDVYGLNDQYEIIDTTTYDGGIRNAYFNVEPRLAARYKLNNSTSLKASYNRTVQYIQQASNGNAATPFDIWFTSSKYVKPQKADQLSLGLFKNFQDNKYEASLEVYYKNFIDAIDFKDHARLLLNDQLEGELRSGKGKAYGVELLIRKNKGRLTGWISYDFSRAKKKIETINKGKWYNAKYDKPHNLSLVGTYAVSKYVDIGANFVYSTGSAVTFPTGRFEYLGVAVPIYSERNGERLPDYHRLDLSLTLRPKKNDHRKFKSEWVFSFYNVYNRKNAFAIDFKQEEKAPHLTYAEKVSVFSIVPSFTYNLKF